MCGNKYTLKKKKKTGLDVKLIYPGEPPSTEEKHTYQQIDGGLRGILVLIFAANWHARFPSKGATLSGTFNTTATHLCFLSWVPTELLNNVVLI